MSLKCGALKNQAADFVTEKFDRKLCFIFNKLFKALTITLFLLLLQDSSFQELSCVSQ